MTRNVISVLSIAGAVSGLAIILIAGHLTFIPIMIVLISIAISL